MVIGGGEEGGRGKHKLNGVEEGVSWGDLVGFYILMKVQRALSNTNI